jgi:hypothetical protein
LPLYRARARSHLQGYTWIRSGVNRYAKKKSAPPITAAGSRQPGNRPQQPPAAAADPLPTRCRPRQTAATTRPRNPATARPIPRTRRNADPIRNRPPRSTARSSTHCAYTSPPNAALHASAAPRAQLRLYVPDFKTPLPPNDASQGGPRCKCAVGARYVRVQASAYTTDPRHCFSGPT